MILTHPTLNNSSNRFRVEQNRNESTSRKCTAIYWSINAHHSFHNNNNSYQFFWTKQHLPTQLSEIPSTAPTTISYHQPNSPNTCHQPNLPTTSICHHHKSPIGQIEKFTEPVYTIQARKYGTKDIHSF